MKRFLYLFIGVALIATLLIANFSNFTAASSSGCKDVNVIFARGSSQNPDDNRKVDSLVDWNIDNGAIKFTDPLFLPNGKEKESAKYFEGIGNRVLKEYPTLSMQFVSLHDFAGKYNDYGYRAVPAFGSLDTLFVSRNAIDARFGYSSIVR